MPSPSSSPFTCTFCWQPSNGPAKAIGKSARLSCSPCYAALIDLAICWVCGEIVYRGEECVSLGWCFWHRACYGCMFYGSKIIFRGVPIAKLFNGRGETGHQGGNTGREVEEPPICAACAVSIEGADVVQASLRRVEQADGGLSRQRWEARKGAAGQLRRAPASIKTFSLRRAADRPRDDAIDSTVPASLESPVYVSMVDPLGVSTFKPSPTKPIPSWMHPHRRTQPVEGGNDGFGAQTRRVHTSTSTSDASTTKNLPPKHSWPPTPSSRLSSPPNVAVEASDFGKVQQHGWVSNEPLVRPSSRLVSRLEKTDTTTASGYVTPPETPSELANRYKTPPPQLRHVRPQSPLTQARMPSRKIILRTPPPQSSEYIEKYNPIRLPSPTLRARQPAVVTWKRSAHSRPSVGLVRESVIATEGSGSSRGGKPWEMAGGDGIVPVPEVTPRKNVIAWKKRLFGESKTSRTSCHGAET